MRVCLFRDQLPSVTLWRCASRANTTVCCPSRTAARRDAAGCMGHRFLGPHESGHFHGVVAGAHLIHGLYVAVDVHYVSSGGARAAADVAADAAW